MSTGKRRITTVGRGSAQIKKNQVVGQQYDVPALLAELVHLLYTRRPLTTPYDTGYLLSKSLANIQLVISLKESDMEWHPASIFRTDVIPTTPFAILILNQPINENAFDAVRRHGTFSSSYSKKFISKRLLAPELLNFIALAWRKKKGHIPRAVSMRAHPSPHVRWMRLKYPFICQSTHETSLKSRHIIN